MHLNLVGKRLVLSRLTVARKRLPCARLRNVIERQDVRRDEELNQAIEERVFGLRWSDCLPVRIIHP